jgi:hypothetical protein
MKDPMSPEQAQELVAQIGRWNVAAISGGRKSLIDGTLILPVGNGYTVEIDLDFNDTYTVRRVFTRGIKRWVKGELSDVYCDEIGERAYEASSFRSYEFPKGVAA